MKLQSRKRQKGFSLIELLVVMAMITVITAIAIISTISSTKQARANAAMDAVSSQFRQARQLAISMRRNVAVNFTNPNKIQIVIGTLAGETPAATIPAVYLNDGVKGGYQFYIYSGVPDTPMGFGNSSAIQITSVNGGGAPLNMIFNSSGMLVGTNTDTTVPTNFATVGSSLPINVTIYTASGNANEQPTQRGITLLGSTGKVRAYYYTGNVWHE
jgi:prepilin-type N-terminal cleavage/methylation domain-containing protein